MRKMTLLVAAFLLTLAAVSVAKPLNAATHLPPLERCWVLVCDVDGACVATEIFCTPNT